MAKVIVTQPDENPDDINVSGQKDDMPSPSKPVKKSKTAKINEAIDVDPLYYVKPSSTFWWINGERLMRLDKNAPSSWHYQTQPIMMVNVYTGEPVEQKVEVSNLMATMIDILDGSRHRISWKELKFIPARVGDSPTI